MEIRPKITLLFLVILIWGFSGRAFAEENPLAKCLGAKIRGLHPDRAKSMPDNIMIYRYYGQKDFNSASTIDLHTTHQPTDAYTAGHMGVARIGNDFQPRGYVIERQFDLPGGLANVAAALSAMKEPGMSLLDHNQTMPIGVMEGINYLDPANRDAELKSAAALNPNQVTFFSATESTDSQKLIAEFGAVPQAAYPNPYHLAWKNYSSMFADFDEHVEPGQSEKPVAYMNPVGTSMLVSGQDLTRSYPLQIETPDLENPIDPETEKFLIGRGAQIRDGSFRESFRGGAYFSYYEFLVRDSVANPETHQVHASDERLGNAKMFAQVNSEDRMGHFTNPENYGFQFYSRYRNNPKKFALVEPLKSFVDGEGIDHFSHTLGLLVDDSDGALNGRQALELVVDAKQRATYYLTESNTAEPLEIQVRDFSSGLREQMKIQVEKSVQKIPALAPTAEHVTGRLNQIEPITEERDLSQKYAEADNYPYSNSVRGDEEKLSEFLEKHNAVEIVSHTTLNADQNKARRELIGAYLDYVAKLKKLGVKDPVKMMIDSKIQFAFTTFGNDLHALYGIPESAIWHVQSDALYDVGAPFFYDPYIFKPEFSMRSDVFSVETIQALIREEPALAKSIAHQHSFKRGQAQYDHFMSEPELFEP